MPPFARLLFLAATLAAAMVQAAPVEASPDIIFKVFSADQAEPHNWPVVPLSEPDGITKVVTEVTV
ncbi:uncharacterized protein CTRU02_203067 [Colletotrichum truncatum]|uniref:Uncharacterized protein n=1 Tax=Colletotrichum truncatum TaxID=5467 RepID=A0ACC3Z873_COLTU|nr:uncharacterized protein CTRU02_08905 [Colletotrichum truncatum]KAF6789113.1 hypothetical protein CTRU02_08905 [Colletotrichum truncatum]